MTSGPPPEEPQFTSEPSVLSPASPKPMHFPTPTNVHVLQMQTDVAFNQTDAHMSDPAMHNTDVRHDAWRDPAAQQADEQADHPSPFSAGSGEAAEPAATEHSAQDLNQATHNASKANSNDAVSAAAAAEPAQATNADSHGANGQLENATIPELTLKTAPAEASHDSAPQSHVSVSANEPTQNVSIQSKPDEMILDDEPKPATNGELDFQALLDNIVSSNLQAVPTNGAPVPSMLSPTSQTQPPPPGVASSHISATSLGAPPSGLPPRPPTQEQPLLHPNYVHSKHIRDFHPHSENLAFQPQANKAGANVALPDINDFAQPVPTHQTQSQTGPTSATSSDLYRQREAFENRGEGQAGGGRSDEDQPWTAETNRKYDQFLDSERNFVNEARWDQFPLGSRLFVGNLSSEKVTKRDIFHVFHHYGDLAQISIKQAYGFVQFLRAEDCALALQNEEGRQIREKKIHLEISKPQQSRSNRNQQQQQQQSRRSRSPDYSRPAAGTDRYVSGGRNSGNRNHQDRGRRDSYRRSPSPHGYNHYSNRNRNRSRSPGFHRSGGGRYRSPSPRRDVEDDLPLPKRQPRDVPDVQIIVLDELDRQFIAHVERAFSARAVRVDVLILSPRLSEAAVVRRQIVEGVLAVVKLTHGAQMTGKIPLQVFNRSQGASNISFEEYANLDPNICVELVLREKAKQVPPTPASAPPYGGSYGYGYSAQQQQQPPTPQQYGMPPQQPQPGTWAPPIQPYTTAPTPPQPPQDLSRLITNLNPNAMQNIMSVMGQSPASGHQQQYGVPPHTALTPGYGQQQNPYASPGMAAAGVMNQQGGAPQQPDMQEILKRLGTYNR